jgi:hypothetical protein
MTENQTTFQTAAHKAALDAARNLVAQLEAEGPIKGWSTDNQNLAIQILELRGQTEEADRVGTELNKIARA